MSSVITEVKWLWLRSNAQAPWPPPTLAAVWLDLNLYTANADLGTAQICSALWAHIWPIGRVDKHTEWRVQIVCDWFRKPDVNDVVFHLATLRALHRPDSMSRRTVSGNSAPT
jgi:hypothetical protein